MHAQATDSCSLVSRDLLMRSHNAPDVAFAVSGHGSQVVNEDGTEEDGFDESVSVICHRH